jgi:hypothetical protein
MPCRIKYGQDVNRVLIRGGRVGWGQLSRVTQEQYRAVVDWSRGEGAS